MPRTDSGRVCAIIENSLTDPQIAAFITTANAMVTEYLGESSLSAAILIEIETYLAAHFITLIDPRSMKEEADGVRFTYEGKTGEGLDGSKYGQMAQALDSTGTLAALGDDDRISFIYRAGSEITNPTQNPLA